MTAISFQWFHYANYVICFRALSKTNENASIKANTVLIKYPYQYDLKRYKIYHGPTILILLIDHLISILI